MLVLGIMSGTSVDGVDYALCQADADFIRLVRFWPRRFPKALQQRLHAAAANQSTTYEVAQLHHDLGRLYARHAAELNRRAELVGLHGQTVFHNPSRSSPATLQIGEPAYLAKALGVPVISNFRAADMAAGGEGAPLATVFHQQVFAQRGKHVCVNNLGGISNVTSLDSTGKRSRPVIRAFDTGPANVLIDLAMREITCGRRGYDKDGALARSGRVHGPLLRAWLKHPYFRRQPPKSTGRELFGEPFFQNARAEAARARLSPPDFVATLTALTAHSIAMNYRLHLSSRPDLVILAGGGAKNGFLAELIGEALREPSQAVLVQSCNELGWPPESIEPAAFALLAYLRWHRLPGNLPATTGADKAVLLGQITE